MALSKPLFTAAMRPLLNVSTAKGGSLVATRHFSASPAPSAANPFFHLQAFSNSRETRWFAKSSGLSPVEHSSQLQLIRSSEGLDRLPPEKSQIRSPPILQREKKPPAAAASRTSSTRSPRTDVNGIPRRLAPTTPQPPSTGVLTSPAAAAAKRARLAASGVSNIVAAEIGRTILKRHAAQRITFKRRVAQLSKTNKRLYRRLQAKTLWIVLTTAAAAGCGAWAYIVRANGGKLRSAPARSKSRAASKKRQPEGVVVPPSGGAELDVQKRLAALYSTPEVHELLEWQRLLGAQEARDAHEIQRATQAADLSGKSKAWWRRLFWS